MRVLKKKHIPFIIFIIILGVMALTNPNQERFKQFAHKQLLKRNFSEQYIKDSLQVEASGNYIFFTQYNFHISDNGVQMQGKYVGVFSSFVELGSFSRKDD